MSHLAETLVVKETQSLTNVRGVVPVMSSHCAGDVPPAYRYNFALNMSNLKSKGRQVI